MARRKRKIVRILIPYGAILLLFFLVEIALRILSPSLDRPFVSEVRYDGIDWYQVNRDYLEKYFPSGGPLVPELKSSLFRRAKQPNTFRVFCLGGSSMFGTPYQMTANIPGMVQAQLRHQYPEREIEVVNLAASAINSNVVCDLSRDIAQYQPDLILVYMGHNEFYGPDGVGASFIQKYFPSTIPLKYRLRELKLVTWLLNIFARTPTQTDEQNLMKAVSEGNEVALDSDDARRIFALFQANLRTVIEFWKERGVPVIISGVSSNLMFPPFQFNPPASAAIVDSITVRVKSGRSGEALANLRQMETKDSANAFVQYWLGRAALFAGDSVAARAHLVRARDCDLLKFRAPSRINAIVRQVCSEEDVPRVSTDSLFSELSPGRIPGDNVFWEHLHPTVQGYYHIAGLFTGEIRKMNLLGSPQRNEVLPFNTDSLNICWLDLAYGDLSIQHLTGRWPFVKYVRDAVVIGGADPQLLQIAIAAYNRKMVWDKACYETALYFWRTRSYGKAITTYNALLEEYPYNFYAHYLLGTLYSQLGEGEQAIEHLERSIASNPSYLQSRADLGMNLINAGKFTRAITHLSKALQLVTPKENPSVAARIYYGLSAANANKGNYEDALRYADEALKLNPDYPDVLRLREAIRAERAKN